MIKEGPVFNYERASEYLHQSRGSVQATHICYEASHIAQPSNPLVFARSIPVNKLCPLKTISSSKNNFRKFIEEFPEFEREFSFLNELQELLDSCNFVSWIEICPCYNMYSQDKKPAISMKFMAKSAENLEKAKSFVEQIIAKW